MVEGDVDAEAIVRAFITAIERRDLDAALALLTDDVEYDNVPIGPAHGRRAVADILAPVLSRSDEVVWPVLRSAWSGNVVFNERLDRFRTGESWVEIAVVGVWEVTGDGRISSWRDYFDLAAYRRQIS